MVKKKHISRRKFIGQASCAAVGSTAFMSTALNLGMINTLAARPHIIGNRGDYKAMVCILLAGGADSYNFLVPTENSEYQDYQTTRSSLALDKDDATQLIPLDYDQNGRSFSVHAGMSRVKDLFEKKKLSFISNIGTLVEPIVDRNDFYYGQKKLPLGLYSHSDQVMHWQTSVPQSRSAVGFAGKMADILKDMNSIPEVSMNISLDGKNRFQSGNSVIEYSLNNNTTEQNIGYEGFPSWWGNVGSLNMGKTDAIESMAEKMYSNVFEKTLGSLTKQTSESIEIFSNAFAKLVPLNTAFSDNNLSLDLKKMAEVISLRSHLGTQRQIFFTTYTGWDHHDNVQVNQAKMIPVVSNAMAEFNDAMIELGLEDQVTLFTISDFARTLTSNGNGSDHAWGGNQMIMGGAVNGGHVLGKFPSLRLDDNDLNVSERGRIIPTTSVDEFYAELALWFGASPNDLDYILPNLCNFYSSSNCSTPPANNFSPIGLFK